MLRISKLADYGTIVMVYLATRTGQVCNAREIAEHTHLTVPTVSKLLKRLTAKHLLTSVRGAAGGYSLQRPASDISVAEIIYALEVHQGLTECSSHPNACSLQEVCHVQGNWRLINQAIESALRSVSLEALAKPKLPLGIFDRIQQLATGVSSG